MRAWHGCNGSWRSHRETSTSRFIWWKASNYRVPIPYHTISRSNCRDMEYLGSLSGSPIEIWRVYSFDFVFEDLDGFSCFLKGFCPLNDLLAWHTWYGRCVWDFKRALGTWLPSIPHISFVASTYLLVMPNHSHSILSSLWINVVLLWIGFFLPFNAKTLIIIVFFLYALTNVPRSGGTKKNHNFVDMADTQPAGKRARDDVEGLCWPVEVMMWCYTCGGDVVFFHFVFPGVFCLEFGIPSILLGGSNMNGGDVCFFNNPFLLCLIQFAVPCQLVPACTKKGMCNSGFGWGEASQQMPISRCRCQHGRFGRS